MNSMDINKEKSKKSTGNLIIKTWQRCKSLGRQRKMSSSSSSPPSAPILSKKSKSWPRRKEFGSGGRVSDHHPRNRRVAAEKGCFSVYVGPEKQRFVIKTEYANHPLFQILLEEAESEYGFNASGRLELPCKVDLFCKVLLAIEDGGDDEDLRQLGCGFRKGAYRILSPPRMIVMNEF